jgi:hypothetical protein
MSEQANARIYRLHELPELIQELGEMRTRRISDHRAELRRYNKRRAGRPEVSDTSGRLQCMGFETEHMGQKVFIARPHKPTYRGWGRFGLRDFVSTHDVGLLANGGKYNRPINAQRVREYADAMVRGQWRDNITDPICITPDGEVINGQHRLAAISCLEFSSELDEGDAARVLVIFEVDPAQITFADTSKRTARDLTVMAAKRPSV